MAKKKRKSGGKGPKKPRPDQALPPLPDRRAIEGLLQRMTAGLEGQEALDTPLARAQALIYQAFETTDERRRSQLAHEALAICPDCADAYVLLAEQAANHRKEALKLYEQAVAAGERALGPKTFQDEVGYFWSMLETRPYMRARLGLAHVLWTLGRRDEAVQHLQDMLRLNPGDNPGVRYTLAGFLLFLDRDADLAQLLLQYPDEPTAAWTYTKALLAFRQHGDTPEARALLKQAMKSNKHVPAYLSGEKYPAEPAGTSYSLGGDSEALEYLASFLVSWKATAGAIAWLRENLKPKKKRASSAPRGPLGFVKTWLNKNLPQRYDIWQADFRIMPSWIQIAGTFERPWTALVTNAGDGMVLAQGTAFEAPSAALLWDTLVQAMQHPLMGRPHRPTELQVRPDEHWEGLRPHLDEIGVSLAETEELEACADVFKALFAQVCGKPRPGLLDMPGITPAQAGSFFHAAAEFFRQSPWKKVGYESAIRIECSKYKSGPSYGVLMGQSGLTAGLALYDDLKALQQLFASDGREEDNARQSVATTVTFGEAWETPIADVDAAHQHGWPVARPDAYPEIFHKERGLSVRPPLAWELELMEGSLRAVPPFLSRHPQDDPAREAMTVPVAGGEMKLTLSWVQDNEA